MLRHGLLLTNRFVIIMMEHNIAILPSAVQSILIFHAIFLLEGPVF